MKRVLFVESYPHALFGQQRTLLSLLDSCHDSDIDPVIAVTAEGAFVDEVNRRNLPVLYFFYPESISSYGGAIYRTKGLRWLWMMGQVAGYIWGIRRRLQQDNFASVFCNDMRGLLTVGIAARSLGIPVMIWDKLDKPHGLMDWLQLPLVSVNVVISNAVLAKYPKWQIRYFSKKISRIPDGVDISVCDEIGSVRNELSISSNDLLIGIIGSISVRKGHDRVFSVWRDLLEDIPNLKLIVVGEAVSAEEINYLKSLHSMKLNKIHFLGHRNDVPALMKSLDILITPSRYEGMGLVIVEAMCASKPVIGTNTGGIPEVVVDGETGIIVEGDSQQDMINAVIRLARSPELRKKMGTAGRARVEKYFNRPLQMKKVLQQLVEMK